MKKLFSIFIILFSMQVFCGDRWDIRAIAKNPNTIARLTRQDGSHYLDFPVDHAKAFVEILDNFSLLSGMYPKIYLQDSNELNAFAAFSQGSPFIVINKRMYEFIKDDRSAAASLIGHEVSHLYFRHGEKNIQNQKDSEVASAVLGTLLEMFFIGKFGVVGVGSDIGNLMGGAMQTSFSRDQEREADKQGLIWSIQAGFDPNGAARLFSKLEKESGNSVITFLKSHPNPSERIENAKIISDLYLKYKNTEVLTSPELMMLNKRIDEERERQLPKSEEAKIGFSAFTNKDYLIAKTNFEICSEKKEVACINNLGVLYKYGLGVPVDIKKATEYYKLASDLGSGLAAHNYTLSYVLMPNKKLDVFELLKLQRDAIEKGSANSMGFLAGSTALSDNSLLPKEWKEILHTYLPKNDSLLNYAKASSMRGAKEGKLALGIYYLYGIGVIKNIDLAESFLNQALKDGDARAIGGLYYLYDVVQKDAVKLELIKSKYINAQNKAALTLLNASFYCTEGANEELQKKCFQFVDEGKYFLTGPALYGYLKLIGFGTQRDEIEGNAWLLYSFRRNGLDFAKWQYEKNQQSLSKSDIETIESRAKQIALEQ